MPFIVAHSDRDLATALGLVHAHLRLAQIEALRRIAYGRLAEVVGPTAIALDHSLRVIDPGRAVPAILAALPAATREWLEGFVAGINHYLAAGVSLPHEFRLLGIAAAPWSIADVLMIARLAAADVNWLLWMRLLRLRRGSDWPENWARLITNGTAPIPSLGSGRVNAAGLFRQLVLGLGRAGSNTFAVAGRHSATGHPWLAGDPHLMLSLPSIWLAAAYRSPSYNVAGLMIPGIPVMAIGRNPWLAWGGTNMLAASSELFDVSSLPPGNITERRIRLAVRWSPPREIVLRDTPHGPIVSDAPLFGGPLDEALAMRWIGHEPSDEITALLAINRARDAAALKRAAEDFAVPGQNLVFADSAGSIGRIQAAWLPRRRPEAPEDLVSSVAGATAWTGRATSADFPAEIDPPEGFVVSANSRPASGDIPVGWFFSPSDRADRLAMLLRTSSRIDLAEIAAVQRDVAAPTMLALRDRWCAVLVPPPRDCPVFDALAAWDGLYTAHSAGALAFELVLAGLIAAAIPPRRLAIYEAAWHGTKLLTGEIQCLAPEPLAGALHKALVAARPVFRRLRSWGGAHRLRLVHLFGAMPMIGRRYRYIDWPWEGTNETVLKSAHGLVTGRHAAVYGSNARYIFDLSDPDANRLVILGGQDGAPNGAAFLDQAEIFRRGEYVEVPLNPATARARFPHLTVLRP